jgi:maltodextrin utilization protein YvdJ
MLGFDNSVLRRTYNSAVMSFITCKLHQVLSRHQIEEDEMVGHVARVGEMRNEYSILVGKSEGKRPLGRTRRKWEGNIRTDLTEIGWNGV